MSRKYFLVNVSEAEEKGVVAKRFWNVNVQILVSNYYVQIEEKSSSSEAKTRETETTGLWSENEEIKCASLFKI